MSDTRQRILDRVSTALTESQPNSTAPEPQAYAEPAARAAGEDLIARFTTRLEQLGCMWTMTENPVEARLRMASQFVEDGVEQLLSWAGDQLPVEGLLEALDHLGIQAVVPNLRHEANPAEVLAATERTELGLVGADAAIADTGTLILCDGPGRSPLASLWPRRLVVLLPLSGLYPSLERWLLELRRGDSPAQKAQPINFSLITGPSRTLDIELAPAVGVHGPRQIHVVLIQGI